VIEARSEKSLTMCRSGWSRRNFASACLAGAGVVCLGIPNARATTSTPLDRSFAIVRDGDEIGRHDVRFATNANGLEVSTDIDIAVKVAFITAFRFEQHAREQWQDGQLVHSNVTTNDNGTKSRTMLSALGDDLSVQGGVDNRMLRVPLGTMTDIAFWNLEIVRQRALVDLQRAELTSLAARHSGAEEIEVGGARIAAERFTINAESGRNGDIWFDAAGNWVKGMMVTRGEKLEYRLLA
jgi:hypothetical protein